MTTPSTQQSDGPSHGSDPDHEMEEYAGGTVQSRHGYIPKWLLVVYAVLFVWALYYAYLYWGGVGPGRIG